MKINANTDWLDHFCKQQQLPTSYAAMAVDYFLPISDKVAGMNSQHSPLVVGINGCQGSGKSTLALLLTHYLTHHHQRVVANLSIDDFYLTLQQRQQVAQEKHPLFITRGVPGTHDMALLEKTFTDLKRSHGPVNIPRFNKATDDRLAADHWDSIVAPVDIILLEGWCVGVTPQTDSALKQPINDLEAEEDSHGLWRQMINQIIIKDYQPIFEKMHYLIMLKAPNFNAVYQWRQKQEDKLKHSQQNTPSTGIMNTQTLKRFIQHYQRLTEHMLQTIPQQADAVLTLNAAHHITDQTMRER